MAKKCKACGVDYGDRVGAVCLECDRIGRVLKDGNIPQMSLDVMFQLESEFKKDLSYERDWHNAETKRRQILSKIYNFKI